ncbi:MAG: hypothetical protein K8S98_08570 [Planctomycetes bacterium]|nr:hypothetical protein [Planctomycetota bacterium]
MQRALSTWLLLTLVSIGAAFTWTNRGLPLVRNSLVYARASEHVIEHGYDPRPVVADSKLSYDKPILYAWCSAPLVKAFGNHDGLRVTSFLTTAAYLFALLHFARSFRALLPEGGERWVLWLGAFGPCVFYQFWSAHPDGWFAALAVFAWSLSHRLVVEPERDPVPRVLALGATLFVAILLKNYGLVLFLSCPLYLVCHVRALRADRTRFRRLLASASLVFVAIGVFVGLAATGHNPLSRLEGEGGGVGQYANGELWMSARGTWVALGIALLVQFHVALLLAFRSSAWTRALLAPLLCFGGVYVAGLMPFPTTFYNMRYFVPLFALAALVLARGAASGSTSLRRGVFALHGVVALASVAVYDSAPVYRRLAPVLPKLEVNWIGVPLSLLDNLRMPLHLEAADLLAHLNARVPPNSTLYWLDVNYYRDAQQGVYERAGLLRADITTHYVSSRGFEPNEASFCFWRASPRSMPTQFASAEDLGLGLFRVDGR